MLQKSNQILYLSTGETCDVSCVVFVKQVPLRTPKALQSTMIITKNIWISLQVHVAESLRDVFV